MLNHAEKRVVDALHVACVRGIISHYAHHLHLLVSYGAVSDTAKRAIRGRGLAEILAIIAEEDHAEKQPLSTAVVVNSETERPGKGFYEQARSLGILIARDPASEEAFWQTQLQRLQVNPLTLKGVVERQESGVIDIPFVVPATGGKLPKDYAQRIQENTRQRGVSPDMTPATHPCYDMDAEMAKAELSSGASVLPGDDFVTPSGKASRTRTQVNDSTITEDELHERIAQVAGDRAIGNPVKILHVPPSHLRIGDVVVLIGRSQVPGMKTMTVVSRPVGVKAIQKSGRRMVWTDTEGTRHEADLDHFKHIEVAQF